MGRCVMSKMTSREHVEALERVLNDKSPDLPPLGPRPGSEPFAGMDHAGMPQGAELARVERAALLSFLPGHRPWEDVSAYDAQLAEITQGAARAMEAVRTLTEQLASEPQRHADALAEWMLHKD